MTRVPSPSLAQEGERGNQRAQVKGSGCWAWAISFQQGATLLRVAPGVPPHPGAVPFHSRGARLGMQRLGEWEAGSRWPWP